MNDSLARRRREGLILIVVLALMLFATPVVYTWARDTSPWYLVYLLWMLIIGLGAWHAHTRRSDDI